MGGGSSPKPVVFYFRRNSELGSGWQNLKCKGTASGPGDMLSALAVDSWSAQWERARGVARVVESMPSMHEALGSISLSI